MPLALFDLDNTLLDREAAFARWADGFCRAHGLPAGAHARLVEADEDGFRDRADLFAADVDEEVASCELLVASKTTNDD